MSALARFQKLSPEAREAFIHRVVGEVCDEPAEFSEMVEWNEAQKPRGSLRPGWTRREQDAYEARVRAAKGSRPGLIDLPGDEERRQAARDAAKSAARRQVSLGGYVPHYPWAKH